jgi:hypothetical protein
MVQSQIIFFAVPHGSLRDRRARRDKRRSFRALGAA